MPRPGITTDIYSRYRKEAICRYPRGGFDPRVYQTKGLPFVILAQRHQTDSHGFVWRKYEIEQTVEMLKWLTRLKGLFGRHHLRTFTIGSEP